jgi:hypothetical protein
MLNPAQRAFITNEQILVPAVFNLALNAGLGWVLFHKHVPVPLWGDPSIANDIIGTLFFLPFFTCLVVTPLVKKAAQAGKVEGLAITPAEHPVLRLLPRSVWARAGFIGLACVVLFAPPSIGLLTAIGMQGWSIGTAVIFKGVFAGLLAALVTPYLALYALTGTGSVEPAR